MITREEISDIDRLYNYTKGEITLGYLEIRVIDEVVDIINIFTNEENRRQGIATSLLEYMFEHENYSRIMLEVSEKNIAALRLYNSLGFKEISMRDNYYGKEPAVIMEKMKE